MSNTTIESTLARFERPLIQYALGLTSGDLEQARDIVQDTFLRLTRESSLPEGDHLAPWLFTVCRNRAHDHHRKSRRIIYLEKNDMETFHETADPAAAPSAVLEQKEDAFALATLLSRLPENQREVIRLKFQHDHSYRDIAEITGLTQGNVGFLLHTGLRKLREMMQHNDLINLTPTRKIG